MTPFEPVRLRTHPKVLFIPAVFALLGLVVMVAAAVFIPTVTDIAWAVPAVLGIILVTVAVASGVPWLRWWCGTFTIDDEKVSVRLGILYRKTTEIAIRRVTQVSCEQGILDRMFGCGTLILADASAMHGGARFDDIPGVQSIQEQLNNLIYERTAGVSSYDPQYQAASWPAQQQGAVTQGSVLSHRA